MPTLFRVFGLLWLVGCLLVPGANRCAAGGAAVEKPNILLIVSDALRADVLGCYGGEAKTPYLDQLAADGVLFENAYSTAPATMASAVSMWTGNYSRAYTVVESEQVDRWLDLKLVTYVGDGELLLGEALREHDYEVRMDIENKLAYLTNGLQGFELIREYPDLTRDEVALVEQMVGLDVPVKFKRTKKLTEYAKLYGVLHYLLTVPREQPFFAVKWFLDPHDPYHPVEEFRNRIDLDTSLLPRNPGVYWRLGPNDMKDLTEIEDQYVKALYRAEVESVDDRIGYLLAALRVRDLSNRTIVIFTSDHGEMFGAHGHRGHGEAFWNPLLQVPLIFAGPGIESGQRIATRVSHLDLSPTLKELGQVDFPDTYLGQSYLPLLRGETLAERTLYFDRIGNVMTERNWYQDALLLDQFKLVLWDEPHRRQTALYDLSVDPGELEDISPSRADLVEQLIAAIQAVHEQNELRLQQNANRIADDVDLESVSEETKKQLRALGYVD